MYVLEDISLDSQQKILRDAAREAYVLQTFESRGFFSDSSRKLRFAVDTESDSYLFRAPAFPREMDNEYYYFYQGRMYVIAVSAFGFKERKTTVYLPGYDKLSDVPDDLRRDLTSAFAVYGQLGYGARGTVGAYNPSFEVIPVFAGED